MYGEIYTKYEPVQIENEVVKIQNYTVAYRRGVNTDPDFYVDKGKQISVIFLHGPDWQSETWEWMGTAWGFLTQSAFLVLTRTTLDYRKSQVNGFLFFWTLL